MKDVESDGHGRTCGLLPTLFDASTETMATITDLSPEILHNLFCFVDAVTLSRLSQTCHQLRDFISRDDLLWRRIYTTRFVSVEPPFGVVQAHACSIHSGSANGQPLLTRLQDEPRQAPPSWKTALQDLIRMEKILNSKDHDLKVRSSTPISLPSPVPAPGR